MPSNEPVMRSTARLAVVGFLLLSLGVAACSGGSRSAGFAPPPLEAQSALLTLHVRLPVSTAGSLSALAYADGARPPANQSARVALSSNACRVDGAERLCTLTVRAPVGLVDVGVQAGRSEGGLQGTALRELLEPGGSTLDLAFDGTPKQWAFSPPLLAAAADGATHEVAFAVAARDALGFVLLSAAPKPPASITITGDTQHQLSVQAQGGGAYLAVYGGQPVGNVSLGASAPGAAAGSAAFSSLVANPSTLAIDPGKSAVVNASLSGYAGSFEAVATASNCSVSPASATPSTAGGSVTFTVRFVSGSACGVKIESSQFQVPIVIPVKNGIAEPGIGVGPSKIKHVVILLQENRSFDNIFGGLDNNGNPFPGADTVSNPDPGEPTPHNHLGQPVAMATGLLEECYDPYHDHPNSYTDEDGGKMDGFDKEGVVQETCAPNPAPTNYVYRTIEYNEVAPYWQMGEKYAISDRMYEPFSSGSYGPHLYIVAGQSANTIDNPSGGPWGCDAPSGTTVDVMNFSSGGEIAGVFPCFAVPTLADIMDQRGIPWRYYATNLSDFGYFWSAFDSFSDVRYGPDWTNNVINPPGQIITDVGNGTLAAVTWVTPTNATSDHPQAHSNLGPAWITSVVDAIGTSQFWDSTAIFITWDDWGGWYDHDPPPITNKWFTTGIRVPLIIVSPYARNGYVSHVNHTTGSILHFTEEVLNLPSLGEEDSRQDDLMDAFNFSQAPSGFTPFVQKGHSKAEIMRAATEPTRSDDPKVGD